MSWTDGRLDDLSAKVDQANRRIDDLGREMHAEFRAVRGEMKMVQATIVGCFVTLFAATLGVMATILTQF